MWTLQVQYKRHTAISRFTTALIDDIELPKRKELMESYGFEERDHSHEFVFKNDKHLIVAMAWRGSIEEQGETPDYLDAVNQPSLKRLIFYIQKQLHYQSLSNNTEHDIKAIEWFIEDELTNS
jgi:hypothetical protein